MNKLLLLLMLLPTVALAQEVSHVCGVNYGDSYNSAVLKLQKVYGATVHPIYKNDLIYYSCQIFEGVMFDGLMFMFSGEGEGRYFDGADFSVSYEKENDAVETRKKLINSLGRNFKITKVTTPEGYIEYCGGTSPTDNNEYGFRIYITIITDTERLYTVHLEFGPY